MIIFSVTVKRHHDVQAWDVRVSAHYFPADEILSPEVTRLLRRSTDGSPGVRIATLAALTVQPFPLFFPEELQDALEEHDEIGGTFDIHDEIRATAGGLIDWAEAGGAERVLPEEADPIGAIVIGRRLETDPFVDRGAILALMIQNLSSLCRDRTLFALEEMPEAELLEDQRGRIPERLRAFRGVSDRVGIEAHRLFPGSGGPSSDQAGTPAQRCACGARPFVVAVIPIGGPVSPEWIVDDEEEIELIDVAEWARTRLGVELIPDSKEGPVRSLSETLEQRMLHKSWAATRSPIERAKGRPFPFQQ